MLASTTHTRQPISDDPSGDRQAASKAGQFHHYLPRFVVRRWRQEVKILPSPGHKTEGSHKKSRGYKQELINSYDIRSDTLHMGTTDLGKTFGIIDLYKDSADPEDVNRVEKAFSKLESDTAVVFKILADAEERGCSAVELLRSQLNTIRKFLFLLFYRNGVHSRQFIEGRFDPVTEDVVKQYVVRYGLADARAVWLRNLALLLEDEHWEVATDERLPTAVRQDYEVEAVRMQPGLYRASPGTEFVLTENGLGLAEGATTPMNHIIDMMSSGAPGASFLPLTRTFPITPKLVIIMRSTAMTCETALLQDGVPAEEARRQVYAGFSNVSYFDDLPRTISKTTFIHPFSPESYEWADRRPEDMTDEDREKLGDLLARGMLGDHSRLQDKFEFAIDNLTQDQVERVNTLLLTHCEETISFLSPACLVQSIEAFEKDEVLTTERKTRYASLKAEAAKLLGSQASSPPTSTSHSAPATTSPDTERPLSQPVPTPGPSGLQPPVETDTLRASLPSLKGVFNRRKARVVPTPGVPDTTLGDPAGKATPSSK